MTPTFFAIKEGATECLKELVDFGLDVEKVHDSTGLTPMQAAFEYNSGRQILMFLVESSPRYMDFTNLCRDFRLRFWEDYHGLSKDGSSLIVILAVEKKRLDLLERILTNSRAAFTRKNNLGVSHGGSWQPWRRTGYKGKAGSRRRLSWKRTRRWWP